MAHLGYFDFADMFGIIAGLELILRANGHCVELGKGVAAVQRVYEAARHVEQPKNEQPKKASS
jgi:aspartate aminotransferase-like enzyme